MKNSNEEMIKAVDLESRPSPKYGSAADRASPLKRNVRNIVRVEKSRHEIVKEHIHRYFKAVHGQGYVYRAPETFQNRLERWMLAVMKDDQTSMLEAEAEIREIEEHFRVV